MNSESFTHDVFLSHSSKDKIVVREIAERLRADGLKVWFDEWVLKPGDSIPAKIEEGLERSRVLVLCMSANAFGSDWAQLESGTFRFRDPLNKERRFIPLRLDDAPIKGSLAQFHYIDWRADTRVQAYVRLLEVCRLDSKVPLVGESGETAISKPALPSVVKFEADLGLTPSESEILVAAPDDGRIYLLQSDAHGDVVSAQDGNFFDLHDASVQAKYLDAFYSLIDKGMIRHEAMVAYRLTGRGFELRKALKQRRGSKAGIHEQVSPKAPNMEISNPEVRPLGEVWSGLRGVIQQAYSTKTIKGILGKSTLPIHKIRYTDTYKGPVLDEADGLVNAMDDLSRDRFVRACIQEIIAFEREKATNMAKNGVEPDGQILRNLRETLARFGYDLSRFESG